MTPPIFIARIVRDVDKHAAGLRGPVGVVLMTLASYCNDDDQCWPGTRLIERSSGEAEGSVAKALRTLKDLGLIHERKLEPGERRRANLASAVRAYWLDRTRILQLPTLGQSRNMCGIDSGQSRNMCGIDSADSGVNSAKQDVSDGSIPQNMAPTDRSIPQKNVATPHVEGLSEREGLPEREEGQKKKERETATFDSATDAELNIAAAWEICDKVAGASRRATRDESSSSALLALIDDSKRFLVESGYPSDLWPKALRARLQAHYGREDRSGWLAANGWPLRVVRSQVPPPRIEIVEPSFDKMVHMGKLYRLMPRVMIGGVVLVDRKPELLSDDQQPVACPPENAKTLMSLKKKSIDDLFSAPGDDGKTSGL